MAAFKGNWWEYSDLKHAVNDLVTDHPLSARIPRAVTPVAALPKATPANAGTRAFVSDSTVEAFGAAVVGGGAIKVPVYCDGTEWKVG